ncbi:hypothetical protein HY633_00665 [Candidatus Uhrbacteria bacterium]|nr:hypothetical protein [Candidatus Uhrbacteria bacterium]
MDDLKDFPFESSSMKAESDEENSRAEQARKAFEALEGGAEKAKPVEEKPFKEEAEGSDTDKAAAQKAFEDVLDRSIESTSTYLSALREDLKDAAPETGDAAEKAVDQEEARLRTEYDAVIEKIKAAPSGKEDSTVGDVDRLEQIAAALQKIDAEREFLKQSRKLKDLENQRKNLKKT